MVPKGWEVKNLKDITSKIQDGNYGAKYPKADELVDQGIPFLTSKALGGSGKTNPEKYDFITIEKHTELKKAHITTNDILFTNRGANVGVIGLAGKDLSDANIGPQLTLIRSNEKLVSYNYLYFFMKSSFFQRQVQGQDSGSAMNFFGIKSTEQFKIKIPPFPEQQKIAKILSTWDEAISTTERLIDNSTQQKKALMQQLLTGKKRLLDESGQQFSGEWSKRTLANFAKIKKGKALSSKDLKEGSYPVIAGGKSSPYTHSDFTHENIITVSASGAYAGYIAYFDYKIWASDCSVIEPRGDNNIRYLYYWLTNQQQKIYTLQSGGAQPHIYPRDLESLKISIPNSVEQQKIATVLTNADKEIELLEQQLADLQQEKKALMQVLLTGKKRVRVDGEVT